MPTYDIQLLTKRFRKVGPAALDQVSFTAHTGEFIVILGPTGAGKTTLLRTLAGLEKSDPEGGTITADGQNISALPPAARDMAMVFQNFSLYPRMTVEENLAFGLKPKWRRIPPAEITRRVRWAADLLGISDKLAALPTQLSGGQQQRVAIGRAIVREPQLFLFDEPLASLDAKLRETMILEIHRLQRRLGVTMLYVTHDQAEAMGLADRIVVLDQGKVLQIGPPLEIYQHPNSPRVARMLGSPLINLLTTQEARTLGLSPALLTSGSTVGIRPEHLTCLPSTAPEGYPACVKAVEHLGPSTIVQLDCQGIPLRALGGPQESLTPNQPCKTKIDPAHILLW